jgi:hypothetical protein
MGLHHEALLRKKLPGALYRIFLNDLSGFRVVGESSLVGTGPDLFGCAYNYILGGSMVISRVLASQSRETLNKPRCLG